MKKFLLCFFVSSFLFLSQSHAQLVDKFKSKVKQRVDNHVDNAMDKSLDEAENSMKGNKNEKKSTDKDKDQNKTPDKSTVKKEEPKTTKPSKDSTPSFKVYQNYDFVPGDKILFEDHFTDDQDGEFPAHWELEKGQATLNKIDGEEAFFLTEGNYVSVKPRMKTAKYLKEPFTVEFDYYNKDNAYGIITFLGRINEECQCESTADVQVSNTGASFGGAVTFNKDYPEELQGDNFINKWHHVAIAVKGRQLKIYVDQNRVLVVPDTKNDFFSVGFGGIGDEKLPIIFKNVRIASGGNMNMLGKKFTDSKIVTHGINFDIDKATLKPESMGTLNMIVQVLKDNPEIKFEIGGHTDNSGTAAHNLTLSQQRAEAVKAQLISMGVDASRLTTKGYGDTKPISDNTSPEGKANNRRVEFVKL